MAARSRPGDPGRRDHRTPGPEEGAGRPGRSDDGTADTSAADSRAAATAVPLRDGPSGLEVLMVERARRGAFAGMWVFPGGGVEPLDTAPGGTGLDAARRAAVRETAEETGLDLEVGSLVPWSHWTPPPEAPRRFLTWFFLAPVTGPDEPTVDGVEVLDARWRRPADVLADRDVGRVSLVPPTWVTLWELSGFGSVAEALAAARSGPPRRYATRIVGRIALWEGDAGWETGDTDAPGPRHRLVMGDRWVFEHTGA